MPEEQKFAAIVTDNVVTGLVLVDVGDDGRTDYEVEGSEVVVITEGAAPSPGVTYEDGVFRIPGPPTLGQPEHDQERELPPVEE